MPVVPIWVNTFVKPLPTARRCYALGNMLKGAIASLPRDMRVAVLASGSFSLEDRRAHASIRAGAHGVPDIEWSRHLHRRIKNAEIDDILVEATPERMWQAGNIGGELLNWIVMLGTVGKAQAELSRRSRRQGRPRLCGLELELTDERLSDQQAVLSAHHDPALSRGDQGRSRQGDRRLAVQLTRSARRCSTGDIKWLYEWGAHPFLLGHMNRWSLFGVTPAIYAERIQTRARSGVVAASALLVALNHGLDVNFQEVVHSARSVNAEVAKHQRFARTEWTLTRMRA